MTETLAQKIDQLDPTAQAVYTFLQIYHKRHGLAPSQREIATACFIANGTVTPALRRLATAGLVEVMPGKSRGIRLMTPEG